jgi:hypothetical protein
MQSLLRTASFASLRMIVQTRGDCLEKTMDHPQNGNGPPKSGRLSFNLTARPAAETGAQAPGRFAGKSRRNLLIGGSVAVPFITTIANRPAFAKTKGGGTSLAASHPTKKKSGLLTPGGDTVATWQQNYPKLMRNHTVEAHAFPATVTGNGYLANPALADVFTVPGARINGVAFTAPDADLHAALCGHGTWEISVTHNGETAYQTMDGRFFAEATAAVLNSAVYGEKNFGMTDAMVIEQVNRSLVNLQSKARVLAELNPDGGAKEILTQIAMHVEGGPTRGEIYYLAQLNSRGRA